ncbi:GNAT family N-acetyltransferase [Acinetobacter sp. NIPH 2699]|uniref:GNAT family N-acetyltransferase n=1 Tax=Acinetobacter sp. NIPH 2699 TaxID=2923433 RepID=UPI001F4AA509|nr:GNAT family N-acetyltransferase [Acinetobacter sp. NIPH 2699]MCH7337468.1 GNAT family N-acetyltransferase [Acinetobacter sp. NIPH 2699]
MIIQFDRLSNIHYAEIIELNTNNLVLQQMPLAKGIIFDKEQCIAWVDAKEKHWEEYGYGVWAFLVDNKFAGWGGLQYEDGDADLALVLHPRYWGLGKQIFNRIINKAFNELNFRSITILLPPTRNKLKAIYSLGFKLEGEITINHEPFIKYRLYKHQSNERSASPIRESSNQA